MTLYEKLCELSAKATPGPWKSNPKRLTFNGVEGPVMSYLTGDRSAGEGKIVTLGSERLADHELVAELVNAFREGRLQCGDNGK